MKHFELMREYLLMEALAFYELYYAPLSEAIPSSDLDNQPLTWVPLVFHATTFKNFKKIISDGYLKPGKNGYISLTELPLGEIDRLKTPRAGKEADIALAFPRRVLQRIGFANALYAKHAKFNVENLPKELQPYVEENDDLGAFQEIRTHRRIPLEYCCWILTRRRDKNNRLILPDRHKFEEKFGKVSLSFWHQSHQLGILKEWQFFKLTRDTQGKLLDFESIGQHYYMQRVFSKKSIKVRFPAGKEHELYFFAEGQHEYKGPKRFIDLALLLRNELSQDIKYQKYLMKYALLGNANGS